MVNVCEGRIDGDVEAFLRQHVKSYEHLEVLLLLRSQRDEDWTSEAAAEKLRITPAAAQEAFEHLGATGVILSQASGSRPAFRYRPASESLESIVDRLVQTYEENPLGIIRPMNAGAIDRVRSAAVRTFANAFRLRRTHQKG